LTSNIISWTNETSGIERWVDV